MATLLFALTLLLAGTISLVSGQATYPLHQAAAARDLAKVKQFISKGVNSKGPDGYTPLQSAIDSFTVYWHPPDAKLKPVVEYLLSKGANPNIAFPLYAGVTGYTVLHYMAYDGNMEIVPLLVKYKANVNAVDSRGFTPIMSAARCDFRLSCDDCSKAPTKWKAGALPTIRFLVSKGADIKAKNKQGQTANDIVPVENCPKTAAYLGKILG